MALGLHCNPSVGGAETEDFSSTEFHRLGKLLEEITNIMILESMNE